MSKRILLLVASLALILALTACGGDTAAPPAEQEQEEEMMFDCKGAAPGDELTMLYQWSGAEEEKILSILQPLVDNCGITIVSEASRDQAVLDTRIESGDPWDVVFWPSTGPMTNYADQLVSLGDAGADASNYASYWMDLGSVDGSWLAVPVKADIKSIIWYSPVAFEAANYEIPTTLDGLNALVEQMVADGNTPWSMGFESGDATGWTGTDFIQDLLLAMEGPEYVLGIIDGSIPYDDPGVQAAYELYVNWATDETYTVGGAEGTLSIGFGDALLLPFSDPPEAMMVKQSGFAGGEVVAQYPELEYGTDFDFFAFPGAQGMQGGADWMMVFNNTPAAQALVAYLTSAEGGQNWAAAGFDLSPNMASAGFYTDAQLAKKAAALESATGFTPDLGDSITPTFGVAEFTAITDIVSGASDIPSALADAAAAQASDLGQ
jgi:alpha-glucoside transport system substrate-binding protein